MFKCFRFNIGASIKEHSELRAIIHKKISFTSFRLFFDFFIGCRFIYSYKSIRIDQTGFFEKKRKKKLWSNEKYFISFTLVFLRGKEFFGIFLIYFHLLEFLDFVLDEMNRKWVEKCPYQVLKS